MIKSATIKEIQDGVITKDHGHLVVTTRYYPRFLDRSLIDDYISDLAPTRGLLKEFKDLSRTLGDHNLAFENVQYEKKFNLLPPGYVELQKLVFLSETKDVFLICFCARHEYCHRDLLLIMAKEFFGGNAETPTRSYPVFRSRFADDTEQK